MLHQPVLLSSLLSFLDKISFQPKCIIDGTFGRGGHAKALLDKYPHSRLVGFDRDREAIDYGQKFSQAEIDGLRLHLIKANYKDIKKSMAQWQFFFKEPSPDLILLDLGVSSPQLDVGERGFSFYHSGPLDMRMDTEQSLTAAEIINTWSEQELSDLFYHLGEIKFPNKVVRTICQKRRKQPLQSTLELADLIVKAEGWRKKGKHPATQYFLALRMRVNNELEDLGESLQGFIDVLASEGLLIVITFHSVEDRLVKNLFKSFRQDGRILTKKVIQAERLEIQQNPRARSAKLRIFQKGVY